MSTGAVGFSRKLNVETAVKITLILTPLSENTPTPKGRENVSLPTILSISLGYPSRHESTSFRGTHPASRNSSLCGGSKGERSSPLAGNPTGAEPPWPLLERAGGGLFRERALLRRSVVAVPAAITVGAARGSGNVDRGTRVSRKLYSETAVQITTGAVEFPQKLYLETAVCLTITALRFPENYILEVAVEISTKRGFPLIFPRAVQFKLRQRYLGFPKTKFRNGSSNSTRNSAVFPKVNSFPRRNASPK